MRNVIEEVFYELCSRIDSPVSLGMWLRYCYAHNELAIASINPLDYNDAMHFAHDYACVSALRKYVGLDTGNNLEYNALLSFAQAEEKCQKTNGALLHFATSGENRSSALLFRMKKIIAKVWGHPTFDDIFRHCDWGPGASESIPRRMATVENKMSQSQISISGAAWPYFRAVIREDYAWLRHLGIDAEGPVSLLPPARFAECAKIVTVPKDAKTDRTIGVEPTAQMFLQKGVGYYIRSRLKRFGIDLNDQSINQNLARRACADRLATIDLKSASDTVAEQLVRVLCPPRMLEVLSRLRTGSYRVLAGDGVALRNFEKFSAMGNGFTFELESLIFYAAAVAVAEEYGGAGSSIGVYGDDLIISQNFARGLILLLEDMGFTINEDKSFIEGRFFESCGKHFFDGMEVTPFYQKAEVSNDLEFTRMANRIFDWTVRLDSSGLLTGKLKGLHSKVLHLMSGTLRKAKVFAPPWVLDDGVLRCKTAELPFCPSNGFLVRYLTPRKIGATLVEAVQRDRNNEKAAKRLSAYVKKRYTGGGTYAYALRLGARSKDVQLPELLIRGDTLDRAAELGILPDKQSAQLTVRSRRAPYWESIERGSGIL